jgi:hypothetical protein
MRGRSYMSMLVHTVVLTALFFGLSGGGGDGG